MDKQLSYVDFTAVTLVHAVEVSGVVMPEGTSGVVMASYEDGLAYEVEFEAPVHVVLTLEHDQIRAVAGVVE